MPTIGISNATQAQAMNDNLAGDYQFLNDIDLTGVTWAPIGTGIGALRFTGTLNGAGFRILKLTINTPLVDYVGFFGSTNGATITNIGDITGSVSGKSLVGACVGRSAGGSISNCASSASVTAAGSFAGGLVGVHATTTTTNCCATGAVATATVEAGGLVGRNQSGVLVNCYATGAASAPTNYAGGLVAYNLASGIYTGCACSGNVSGAVTRSRICPSDISTAISTGAHLTDAQMTDARWFATAGWDMSTIWAQSILVPNVVGATKAAAVEAIVQAGAVAGAITREYSDTVAAGLVISQNPVVGGTPDYPRLRGVGTQAVAPLYGDAVDLVISLGRPVVPNVIGLEEAPAIAALNAVGLVANVSHAYFVIPAGAVIYQSPDGGTATDVGGTVDIIVSLGVETVAAPDVVGMMQANATIAIQAAGLVEAVSTAYNTAPAGQVITQSPAAATVVAVGSTVCITVSIGLETVAAPDVVGMTQAAAVAAIEAAGLVADVSTAYHPTVAAGAIISQIPVAGASVVIGSTVAIVTSLGVEPVTVPSLVGLRNDVAQYALTTRGLTPSVTTAHSATVRIGLVISQAVAAGTAVAPGTSIGMVVSLGAEYGPMMAAMNYVRHVLSESAEFRTFVNVATPALADAKINYFAGSDNEWNQAVVSLGDFTRECDTYDQTYTTNAQALVEFIASVDKDDDNATVFSALTESVDAIMLELEAQTDWRIQAWQPEGEQTPSRVRHSSETDMASLAVLITGNLFT